MSPHCSVSSVSVTEFVGYGELQQLWRSLGRLPENLVKIYLAQIALALGKVVVVVSVLLFFAHFFHSCVMYVCRCRCVCGCS